MKLYINLFMLGLFPLYSNAETSVEEFCTSYSSALEYKKKKSSKNDFENDEENSKNNIKFLANVVFSPKSLVDFEVIKGFNSSQAQSESHSKIAFVNFPKIILTKQDKRELKIATKELNKSKKNIKKLGIVKKLKLMNSKESCLEITQANPEIISELENYSKIESKYTGIFEKSKNANTYGSYQKYKKFLLKNKWQILEEIKSENMISEIEKAQATEVLLISHSTSKGEMVDSEKRAIKVDLFEKMPASVNKVVLYNCYANKSLEKYNIKKLYYGFDTYYSISNEKFNYLLNDKVPLQSIRSLKRVF